MYLFSKILLHIAGTLILLHTITPHSHNNVAKESHVQSICFQHTDSLVLKFILNLVCNNLGEHHLEDYLNEETSFNEYDLMDDFNDLLFVDCYSLSLKNLPPLLINHFNSKNNFSKSLLSLHSINFRGPPLFKK